MASLYHPGLQHIDSGKMRYPLSSQSTICAHNSFGLTHLLSSIASTLADWVAKYGPVVTLCQGSQIIIVIGRVDVRIMFVQPVYVR